jgi:hypothetical protein
MVTLVTITFLIAPLAMAVSGRARGQTGSVTKQLIVLPVVPVVRDGAGLTPGAPRNAPHMRAAVAQAMVRLPVPPLTLLVFLMLVVIDRWLIRTQACSNLYDRQSVSQGQRRALLGVFLI